MNFLQTYESHVVGMGEPFINKTGGVDTVTWIPFCQALSVQSSKQIQRYKHIHSREPQINRQNMFSEPTVSLKVIDSNERPFEDLNIQASAWDLISGYIQNTGYQSLLNHLYTGQSGVDGGNIYLITDTDERARDQIGSDSYDRQLFVVENTFLDSINWSASANSIAMFDFSFVGTDFISGSWTGNLTGINLSNATRSTSLSISGMQDFSTGTVLTINNISGIYIGNNITVSGAPDFGEINSVSWSIPVERHNIIGLGSPFTKGKPMLHNTVGTLNIGYNYEGQKDQQLTIDDDELNIVITSTNKNGDVRDWKMTGVQISSWGIDTSIGNMDTLNVSFEFPLSYQEGLYERNRNSYEVLDYYPEEAAGAYSIYDLGNARGSVTETEGTYINPTVRIRRGIDDEHRSFTESEIVNNVALDWVNEEIYKISGEQDWGGNLARTGFTTTTILGDGRVQTTATTYITISTVDGISGCVTYEPGSLGFSWEPYRFGPTLYTGMEFTINKLRFKIPTGSNCNLIKIKGDNNNILTSVDLSAYSKGVWYDLSGIQISPYTANITTPTNILLGSTASEEIVFDPNMEILISWKNGYVATLYNQAGTGYDMSQSTAAYQPKIISSGEYIRDSNNNISLYFDNDFLSNTGLGSYMSSAGAQPRSFFTVSEVISSMEDANGAVITLGSAIKAWMGLYTETDAVSGQSKYSFNSMDDSYASTMLPIKDAMLNDTVYVGSAIIKNTDGRVFLNGISGAPDLGSLGGSTYDTAYIGMLEVFGTKTYWYVGPITAGIFYKGDKTDDRAAIEQILADRFKITL